jgi:type III restriction enzyme
MDEIVAALPDHRAGGLNTEGSGSRSTSTLKVGADEAVPVIDSVVAHSSSVTARWLVSREMRTLYPDSLTLLDPEDIHADKLDAMVDRTSNAAKQFREAGHELVKTYLEGSRLHVESTNLYQVGPIEADTSKTTPFVHAVHDAYELNNLELPVARAIDATGCQWCRNPQGIGFRIPLLDSGGTRNFFPDFLVWKDGNVFAIDPKGPQLLRNDAGRKTMNITSAKGDLRILSRLISAGKWTDELKPDGPGGYTVWRWEAVSSSIRRRHFSTVDAAVAFALKV